MYRWLVTVLFVLGSSGGGGTVCMLVTQYLCSLFPRLLVVIEQMSAELRKQGIGMGENES